MRRLATARRILIRAGVTMELAEIDLTTAAVHLASRSTGTALLEAAASGEATRCGQRLAGARAARLRCSEVAPTSVPVALP